MIHIGRRVHDGCTAVAGVIGEKSAGHAIAEGFRYRPSGHTANGGSSSEGTFKNSGEDGRNTSNVSNDDKCNNYEVGHNHKWNDNGGCVGQTLHSAYVHQIRQHGYHNARDQWVYLYHTGKGIGDGVGLQGTDSDADSQYIQYRDHDSKPSASDSPLNVVGWSAGVAAVCLVFLAEDLAQHRLA